MFILAFDFIRIKNLILDKISAAVHEPSTLTVVASNIPHVHSNLHPDNLTLINITNFKININFDICNVSQIGRYQFFLFTKELSFFATNSFLISIFVEPNFVKLTKRLLRYSDKII